MKVLRHLETPGLGDKIVKNTPFVAEFDGVEAPIQGVKPDRNTGDPAQVDMITGATISSKAVIAIINDRIAELGDLLAALSARPELNAAGRYPPVGRREPMRATTPQQDFIRGIWEENPVLVQLLGLCPALAVTNTVLNSLAMAGATIFVLLGSSLLVSLLKKLIPHEVRISTYILIIATFVTIVDMALGGGSPRGLQGAGGLHRPHRGELHDPGPAGGLRIQAAGRAEPSWTRLGTGAGFAIAMVMMGTFREILGSGTLGQGTPWVGHSLRSELRALGDHDQPSGRLLHPRIHPALPGMVGGSEGTEGGDPALAP